MAERALKAITLCAASDVALEATIRALEHCLDQFGFAETLFFSSHPIPRKTRHGIRHVPVAPLRSREDYSEFVLSSLGRYIETDFALIVQWDGFIVDSSAWTDDFLRFDYLGAPWVGQPVGREVGNGGFSLRSKRLLDMGAEPWFQRSHPEDLCISQVNRDQLERRGVRIADPSLARQFAREREPRSIAHFGIHGIFALAEQMEPQDLADLLAQVEYGVMGKRELLDVIRICNRPAERASPAAARCMSEFLKRFPLDRRAPKIALDLLKWRLHRGLS